MNSATVLDSALTAMIMGAKLAVSVLITLLVVGFVISLLQSITRIQEVTLTSVPKTIAMGIALYICGYRMLQTMANIILGMMARIPHLLNS